MLLAVLPLLSAVLVVRLVITLADFVRKAQVAHDTRIKGLRAAPVAYSTWYVQYRRAPIPDRPPNWIPST